MSDTVRCFFALLFLSAPFVLLFWMWMYTTGDAFLSACVTALAVVGAILYDIGYQLMTDKETNIDRM